MLYPFLFTLAAILVTCRSKCIFILTQGNVSPLLPFSPYCLGTVLKCSKLTKYGLVSMLLPTRVGQLFLELMPESLNINLEFWYLMRACVWDADIELFCQRTEVALQSVALSLLDCFRHSLELGYS